jgi:putative nucleotidyltransferase with HDIG domain
VDRGEIIDSHTFRILESMHKHLDEREKSTEEILLNLSGQAVYTCLIVILFFLYFQQFRNDYLDSPKVMLLICTLFLFFPLLTYAIVVHSNISPYILPFCITPVFVRIFMDSRTAFMAHLMTILMCIPAVSQPAEFVTIQILAGLTAVISLRQLSERSELFRAILIVFSVSALAYISMQLISRRVLFIEDVNYTDLISIAASSLLLMISYLLLIPIEKVFGFTSNVTLIELSNANNPILRRMSEEAPGTFQHSMQVANLAAAVAERLGAKNQLVRTGALYHDIGKIRHAAFYTENQRGINPHDRLTDVQSAQIIISHVREGLALAEKHKLPQVIKDFITTHHGNSITRYFYIQAQNKCPDIEIDPATFTYPGPEPTTMEQAILMMCDAVEAASRSLKEITEETISELVNKIVDGQVSEGHFKNAPITFQDIENAKQVLKAKLQTIYHTRIQYPELKK